jgi:hypothetical protein
MVIMMMVITTMMMVMMMMMMMVMMMMIVMVPMMTMMMIVIRGLINCKYVLVQEACDRPTVCFGILCPIQAMGSRIPLLENHGRRKYSDVNITIYSFF